MSIMIGEKPAEDAVKRVEHTGWYWTTPTYEFELDIPIRDIQEIEIDPSQRMADIDRSNNKGVAP